MRWRRLLVRLAIAVFAAALAWMIGFYAGQAVLDALIDLVEPADRYAVGHDVLLWLRGLGPVDVAFTLGGLVLTGGASWAWRTRHVVRPDKVVFGAIPRQAAWFQTRAAEQLALERALGGNGRAALVALPGARGAGKSQLAASHARRCAEKGFDLVAWINAEDSPVTELALLGERLGLRKSPDQTPQQVAAATIEKISTGPGRRLMVYDNVDDPDDIKDFLPAVGTTKVLITTNRREVTTMPNTAVVEVGMFTPAQGRALLTAATGLPNTDDTFEVGQMLGWLPLGVAQAGAYIKLNTITYRQYLQRMDRTDVDDVLMRQAGTAHVGVLQATRLSLNLVDDLDLSGNARRVLTVLSILAPEGVRRSLLLESKALPGLDLTTQDVQRALTALANTTLITQAVVAARAQSDSTLIAVHRLTAKIVRHDALNAETYDNAIDAATEILAAIIDDFPRYQSATRRVELEELASHAFATRGHARQYTPNLELLCNYVGGRLTEVGDYARAISLRESILAEAERALGPDHPDTLFSRNNLAASYDAAGRHDEAIRLEEENLEYSERVLGADEPETLLSRNNLAATYAAAGRYDDAIRLHERNLADSERVLGPDHPDTLLSRSNLADSYRSAGRYEDALRMEEQNLADSERILGADHPDTLMCRNNLAASYSSVGRNNDALRLHKQTLADRERILGLEHPDTLMSRSNVAHLSAVTGNYREAIRLHEQTLADRERLLGPDHPSTRNSRAGLASAYRSAGRHRDADRLEPPDGVH